MKNYELEELSALVKAKEILEAQLKAIKKSLEELEEKIIANFEDSGVESFENEFGKIIRTKSSGKVVTTTSLKDGELNSLLVEMPRAIRTKQELNKEAIRSLLLSGSVSEEELSVLEFYGISLEYPTETTIKLN